MDNGGFLSLLLYYMVGLIKLYVTSITDLSMVDDPSITEVLVVCVPFIIDFSLLF